MKNSSKSIVACIFGSLLLAIFLSVIAIMLSVKLGFISENVILDSMDEVDYYQMVYDDFIDKCESLAIPNGLNATVFKNVFTVEQVHSDGSSYLKAELNSTVFEIDTEGYKQKLSANIYDYVKKNNLTADGDIREIVEEFTNDIMDYYIEIIRLPHAASMGAVFRTISDYFPLVFAAMTILSVCTLWILIKQNRGRKARLFRYLAYSTMSGAVSVLFVPVFCLVSEFYKKLQIYPEYMYNFIVNYFERGINTMLITGALLFEAAGVMICFSSCMEYQIRHGNRKKQKNSDIPYNS
ncbi:MAG: hypothetical protein HFI34_09275 [Lachnospiraceae bacterium]|nr:hypothetical protein [Lachnospiraceae bacterium]